MFRALAGLFALVVSLTVAACSDGTSAPRPGEISVLLTDDPGPFAKVVVQIERVYLVGEAEDGCDDVEVPENGDTPECEDEVSVDGNGRIDLSDELTEVDLIALSNDIVPLAEGFVVPGGSYSQLRLVVRGACLVLENGETYASSGFEPLMPDVHPECEGPHDGGLQTPSWGQSGLKVKLPGGSIDVDGDRHIVLLDFVVHESFAHQAGGSGKWVARPVIRATEIGFSGSITVSLTAGDEVKQAMEALGSSLADFQAQLDSEPPVALEDSDGDGVYTATFLYVVPRDEAYEVAVGLGPDAPEYDFTLDPESPQGVTIGSAEDAEVAFEVTSATAPSS
jgi:hypothetical protein